MQVIAMATGGFSVPTLNWLAASKQHQLLALITRPVRQHGHRRHAPHAPAREFAESRGLPIYSPDSVNTSEFRAWLRTARADLVFVCDFGEILSSETLAAARLGGINLHGSLLPKYRGAAPVQWALLRGETITGVSVIHMTSWLDAGPILVQESLEISPFEDASELESRLAQLGVRAVEASFQRLSEAKREAVKGVTQDARQATRAPRLTRDHGEIDWTKPAWEIHNQVRALQPWPGAFTHCLGLHGQRMRLQVLRSEPPQEVRSPEADDLPPGSVIPSSVESLKVATGRGALTLLQVRPENRKALSGRDFLHGYREVCSEPWGASKTESPPAP